MLKIPATYLAALALTFNALVWGVSWWPFRELQGHGLHPLWATALVYLFSMVCLTLVKPAAWRDLRKPSLLWLLFLASGLTLAAIGLMGSERVSGIVYIGTTTAPLEDRPRPDPQALLTRWVKA